jgi:hypothetical protein
LNISRRKQYVPVVQVGQRLEPTWWPPFSLLHNLLDNPFQMPFHTVRNTDTVRNGSQFLDGDAREVAATAAADD